MVCFVFAVPGIRVRQPGKEVGVPSSCPGAVAVRVRCDPEQPWKHGVPLRSESVPLAPCLQEGDRDEFLGVVPGTAAGQAVPEDRIGVPVEQDPECVGVACDALMPQVFVGFPH